MITLKLMDHGPWPRWVSCPWCRIWAKPESAHDELKFWKNHAECFPVPVRDALEAGWGQEGVHGGGLDPYEADIDIPSPS